MATGKLIFHHNKKDIIESVSDPATIAERTQRRKRLDDIQAPANELDHPLLPPKDLEECYIRHERMSLEEEPLEEESKPLYFTPCKASIEDTNNQRLVNWYPKLEADDDHYSRASFLTWYLREYFLSYNLPKEGLIPSGSRYREFVFPYIIQYLSRIVLTLFEFRGVWVRYAFNCVRIARRVLTGGSSVGYTPARLSSYEGPDG